MVNSMNRLITAQLYLHQGGIEEVCAAGMVCSTPGLVSQTTCTCTWKDGTCTIPVPQYKTVESTLPGYENAIAVYMCIHCRVQLVFARDLFTCETVTIDQ
eukprot:scpid49586/ scgid31780/ 